MVVYFSVALGILVSVALPLIRAMLPKPPTALAGKSFYERTRPYFVTALFSLVVALIVVAWMGDSLDSWRTAFIAGYTWDSTLQKLTTGNAQSAE